MMFNLFKIKNLKLFTLLILALCFIACKKQLKTNTDFKISEKQSNPSITSPKKYPFFGSIDRFDPSLDSIISKNAIIEIVAEGFNWAEGPVWLPNEQKLLFSDVPENKIYQWSETDGLSLYMKPSGYTGTNKKLKKGSNGLILNPKGDLLICQEGDRVISKLISLSDSLNPKVQAIITRFQGKKFNSPNDLTFDTEGNIYFTDPSFGLGKGTSEIGFNGVYVFDGNTVTLIDNSIKAPNGIAVSNDNTKLYVADSDTNYPKILVFDILKTGSVTNKQVFFDATALREESISKQSPDGMKISKSGNIFLAGPDGVLIINDKGTHLGTIKTDIKTGNCEFSDNEKYLFITADNYLLRVTLKP